MAVSVATFLLCRPADAQFPVDARSRLSSPSVSERSAPQAISNGDQGRPSTFYAGAGAGAIRWLSLLSERAAPDEEMSALAGARPLDGLTLARLCVALFHSGGLQLARPLGLSAARR